MDPQFRQRLLDALTIELHYEERMQLEGGTPAAVLVLFGRPEGAPPELSVLITKRTENVGSHKGQMAFPGGVSEPEEISAKDGAIRTALRETEEEVGIDPSRVEILGQLPPMSTITNFRVTPVVGYLLDPIDDIQLRLNPHEIAEVLWIPFRTLTDPDTYRTEYKRIGPVNYPIHVYQVSEHRIWGVTGSMIKNLLDRLQALS